MTIKGKIEAIVYEEDKGHTRKVVTVKPDHRQTLFVQFPGKKMEMLNNIEVNDEINVSVFFNGKQSELGVKYNNLIADSVEKTKSFTDISFDEL